MSELLVIEAPGLSQFVLSDAARGLMEIPAAPGQLVLHHYGAAQFPIQFQDEGANQGAAGEVLTMNFTGAGVTAVYSLGILTVTIPGGGGGGGDPGSWGAITGTLSDQTDLQAALNAKAASVHGHAQSDVTGLVAALASKAATVHSHAQSDVTNLVTDLAAKAASVHTHAQSDVTNLVTDLAAKAASVHTHAQSDVTNLVTDLAAKAAISYVDAAIATVLGGVSSAFDTLSEIATALGLKLNAAAVSAFGLTLIDDADAATARTTLGLGTLATQSGTFSGTSSGTNTGDQSAASLGLGTSDNPQFAGVNVGHASDTTITRPAAGQVAVEGKRLFNDGDRGVVGCVIDGGGAVITTGIKGDIGPFTFACTIEDVTLIADQSGSIVVDIWKNSYANYPPVVGDSIAAADKPTISAATKSQNSTLTGWTTAIAIGDILRFNVDSIATCQRVALTMKIKRT